MSSTDGQAIQDIITKLRSETMKSYTEYDGLYRRTRIVQANSRATHGGDALETKFFYSGDTNREVYREENIISWNSSWEQS
tara:strand:+ start:42229 stop:42471 length:243 start_codon:yes stop_codon:yes gene_type:complete